MCFMIHEILKYEIIFYFDGEDGKTNPFEITNNV